MELNVHESPTHASAATASTIVDRVRSVGRRSTLGLAGGSTPAATYEMLRDADLDWDGVDCWLPDERWVPHNSERSNGRMALETLVGHTSATLHRPRWAPDEAPDVSAAEYESVLQSVMTDGPDLVFLGMGDDGHTASLFPGSDALDETEHIYVANTIPETGEPRLTATYPLLHRAATTVFLVFGSGKAPALRATFENSTPAGRIAEGRGEVIWHVDRAAASLLS